MCKTTFRNVFNKYLSRAQSLSGRELEIFVNTVAANCVLLCAAGGVDDCLGAAGGHSQTVRSRDRFYYVHCIENLSCFFFVCKQ
jgi:hypothetical protein